MDFMYDVWDNQEDRYSFDDSDRFDEDSICSWVSEPESVYNNWRGWKKQNGGSQSVSLNRQQGLVTPLVELSAQAVACHIPFEVVEHFPQPIPEQLQLRIAFWSFPENEEDIRLYSCLANGSADEFQRGEHLYKNKAVRDVLQIGFHLSATVVSTQALAQSKSSLNVSIIFDRRRISSCNCTCSSTASWCSHVVALCLYRIHQANSVKLRAPVSESLSRLQREQLQKFAQYLISELPRQILPTAQKILDELLSSQKTAINTVCGAPDPTAGPSAHEQTSWCLDEATLHDNVKKTLVKFCIPSPIVFSDVNYLTSSAPPAATEWQSLLRPLRGREPEGMWNLLSIVREMLRRNDTNAIPLLEILTDEILQCEQILTWWFGAKISTSHNTILNSRGGSNSATATQHAASSLCDEFVALWRLIALNPRLSPMQRDDLCMKFQEWHIFTIEKVRQVRTPNISGAGDIKSNNANIRKLDIEIFSGFKPSIEACQLDWDDYHIPGVTYIASEASRCKYPLMRSSEDSRKPSRIQVTSMCSNDLISTDNRTVIGAGRARHANGNGSAAHRFEFPNVYMRKMSAGEQSQNECTYSSGSEGFCEPDRLDPMFRDSDSSLDLKESDRLDDFAVASTKASAVVNKLTSVKSCVTLKNDASHKPPGSQETMMTTTTMVTMSTTATIIAKNQLLEGRSSVESDNSLPGAVGGEKTQGNNTAPNTQHDSICESHRSSDEYQLYYYDTSAKVMTMDLKDDKKDKMSEEPNYFAGLRKITDKQEILFARAEALHAHGHTKEASKLARQLAEEMLANPVDLLAEATAATNIKGKGKKKKAQHGISVLASAMVAKAAFLTSVLAEDADCHYLAFKVGMFGLEMPRPPASSKAFEVKLNHQESELVNLLKKIPLSIPELSVLRERAESLRDGSLKSRGEALLPLTLASFIFDSISLPTANLLATGRTGCSQSTTRLPHDEKLGFEAAVAALGLKANVCEADHPLLCEGTRRQKGDLAIALLVHYKDDQVKLTKIMDKILDKDIHQLYRAPSLSSYLASSSLPVDQPARLYSSLSPSQSLHAPTTEISRESTPATRTADSLAAGTDLPAAVDSAAVLPKWANGSSGTVSTQSLDYLNLEQSRNVTVSSTVAVITGGARPKTSYVARYNSGKDTEDSSALEEDADDLKDLDLKLRVMNIRKKPSQGMASIDSSAPETTSSGDNSPTLIRRQWAKHQGPGSDSGSSGKSSDSIDSSSSGDKATTAKHRDDDSPPSSLVSRLIPTQLVIDSRSSTPNVKTIRYRGKNRMMPTIPNQPSEASAHFMFELAKTVLSKGGGSSSTSLFTQPSAATNHSGPHRALQLCAFQIGLYALGLHNCVTPNWLSRTYSSHVSWITGQAMEIGAPAINILIETWQGHLTPPEVASLADRASRGRDPSMAKSAAELALSCLPHAHALNQTEIQRVLMQCKEQSRDMLERANLEVENAAKDGGVYPEVLFDVAKRWYELSEEAGQTAAAAAASTRGQESRTNQESFQAAQSDAITSSHVGTVRQETSVHQATMFNQSTAAVAHTPSTSSPVQIVPHAVQHQSVILPYTIASHNPATAPPPHPQPQAQQRHHGGAPLHSSQIHASQIHSAQMHSYVTPPYTYIQPMPSFPPAQQPHYNQTHHSQAHHNQPHHNQPHHNQPHHNQPHHSQPHHNQPHHNQPHHNQPHHLGLHSHGMQPAYVATYFQNQGPHAYSNIQPMPPTMQHNPAIVYHHTSSQSHLRMPVYNHHVGQAPSNQPSSLQPVHQPEQTQQVPPEPTPPPLQSTSPIPQITNQIQMNYLLATYRVGMLAMELLARRVHDDRPQTKYSRNPSYGEDVKWLLNIAIKLGSSYLQQFCVTAVSSLINPFILYDIAVDSMHALARSSQAANHLRSHQLNNLIQRCQQMFVQCAHQRIHHINQTEYDEFIGIICSARNAFYLTQGGVVPFSEFLQSIRRFKQCRKELWTRIVSALHTGNL